MRNAAHVGLVLLLSIAGCAWQKDVKEAQLQADEARLAVEACKKEKETERDECAQLRAQKDRLFVENGELQRQLEELRGQQRGAAAKIAAAEESLRRAGNDLEGKRKDLENALATLRRSRDELEQTLADRQRQIEMLTNQVERLSRELAAARAPQTPAPKPR